MSVLCATLVRVRGIISQECNVTLNFFFLKIITVQEEARGIMDNKIIRIVKQNNMDFFFDHLLVSILSIAIQNEQLDFYS